jgi:hypothetical protein
MKRRVTIASLMLGLGALQAWDSHVLSATPAVIAVVAVALALPAGAVFSVVEYAH